MQVENTYSLQGLWGLHGQRIYPALQASAWRNLYDVWRVHAYVQTQDERHSCGLEPLFLAPFGYYAQLWHPL